MISSSSEDHATENILDVLRKFRWRSDVLSTHGDEETHELIFPPEQDKLIHNFYKESNNSAHIDEGSEECTFSVEGDYVTIGVSLFSDDPRFKLIGDSPPWLLRNHLGETEGKPISFYSEDFERVPLHGA
mmetsp:Transcript_3510/g.6273  ORF Transcript_3510/g.6273 Transcript_3510/m.6273 type:complete len:130 (-) Transcript_3510:20-409(-)